MISNILSFDILNFIIKHSSYLSERWMHVRNKEASAIHPTKNWTWYHNRRIITKFSGREFTGFFLKYPLCLLPLALSKYEEVLTVTTKGQSTGSGNYGQQWRQQGIKSVVERE